MSDKEVRAVAMARAHHQNTEPAVDTHILEVDCDACTGPRAGYTTKAAEGEKTPGVTRVAVLVHWERENLRVLCAVRHRHAVRFCFSWPWYDKYDQ